VSTQTVLQPVNDISPGILGNESDCYDAGDENLDALISLMQSETITNLSETLQHGQSLDTSLRLEESSLSISASCQSLHSLKSNSLPDALDQRLLQVS